VSATIHPSAQVSPKAEIADGVTVGPYCTVGDNVRIGAGTRLLGHAAVLGPTILGEGNTVHPFAVLGGDPQDRSYAGEPTRLEIGDSNVFREHVTVNRGTVKGGGVTRIGSHCLFMAASHIAHDVQVGNDVTFANATLLGGHVTIEDHVTTGGHAGIAPFVCVGESAFVAAGSMVERGVPPFVIVQGDRARVRALNRVGLGRRAVPEASRQALEKAFRKLFRDSGVRSEAVEAVAAEFGGDPYVAKLVAFLKRAPFAP
jgi:UDP-N-acetylglucosamine acyltransferase